MKVLPQDDSSIALVFPGVRQFHDGTQYREGRTKDEKTCFVDARDSRTFTLTDGRFEDQTLHVVVTEADGRQYRAGSGPAVGNPRGEQKLTLPQRYYIRERGRILRVVG